MVNCVKTIVIGCIFVTAGCNSASKGDNDAANDDKNVLKVGETVQCLAWHPKGSSLAVLTRPKQPRSGEGYRIRLWNPKSGEPSKDICETSEVMESVAFSPDGTRVAGCVCLSKNQTPTAYLAKVGDEVSTEIRQWNASTGEQVGTLLGKPCTDLGAKAISELMCIAHSPKGDLVGGGTKITGTYPIHGSHVGGEVCVWDVSTGQVKWNNRSTHTDIVYAVAFSPDGKLLASGGTDKLIRLWNPETGELIKTLHGVAYDGIIAISFSPDGKWLASSGYGREEGGRIRVWDVQTGELKHTIGDFSREVHALFVDKNRLCAAGVVENAADPSKRWWALAQLTMGSREPKRVFPKRIGTPSVIAVSNDRKTVAVGTYEGEVCLFSIGE